LSTPLTDYYRSLTYLKEQELTALAETHADDPSLLISRFLASVEAVEGRTPIDEPFHGKRSAVRADDGRGLSRTIDFVTYLQAERFWNVSGQQELAFRYVDYEIFPARKTVKETRELRHSTDVLLANMHDGMPIVTELKIRGDKPAYFALVQILMLASEFQSAHQRKRLLKHYASASFNWAPAGPYVDVYILVFEPPKVGKYRERSFNATKQISEQLMKDGRFAKIVRRIAYIEAAIENDDMAFKKLFAFGTFGSGTQH